MAVFGGYEMPLWYSTAKKEHLSVLTNAGIFDTSHMAVVMVAGSEAYKLLQLYFTLFIQVGAVDASAGRKGFFAFTDASRKVIGEA